MSETTPIHTPGALLRSLLDERGWTQEELALITNCSRQSISAILAGRSGVTAEMAVSLAAAFGNEPSEWLRLDMERQLSLVEGDASDVERRMRLFEIAPVRDMQRRGWISETKKLEELEEELKDFFEVKGELDEDIGFPVAARRTVKLPHLNRSERAWCFRARQLAREVHVQRYNPAHMETARKKLRIAAAYAKEAFRVPQILADCGIRYVVVEPLPGARIDGAAFWLDESSPVIAMSTRYDRIDNFWFTLMHEFSHIRHQDSLSVDNDIDEAARSSANSEEECEKRANEEASASLIPPDELDSFIRRVGPLYSKPRIIQLAHRLKIHPGIIVGQLYHKGEIGPSANREMLAKVRNSVLETAIVDGYGRLVPSDL